MFLLPGITSLSGRSCRAFHFGTTGHTTRASHKSKQARRWAPCPFFSFSSVDLHVNVTRWHSHCIRCITRLLLCNLLGSNAVRHGIPSPSFSCLNVIFPFFRWVYLGESFPLRVRPKSIALGSATNWLVFILSILRLLIRKSCSGSGTSSWASLLRGLLKSAFHLLLLRVSRTLGYATKSLSCTMSQDQLCLLDVPCHPTLTNSMALQYWTSHLDDFLRHAYIWIRIRLSICAWNKRSKFGRG